MCTYIPHASLIFHSYFSYLPNRFLLIFFSSRRILLIIPHICMTCILYHHSHHYYRFSCCSISIFAHLIHKLVTLFNIPSTLFFALLLTHESQTENSLLFSKNLHMLKKSTQNKAQSNSSNMMTDLSWVAQFCQTSHRLFFTTASSLLQPFWETVIHKSTKIRKSREEKSKKKEMQYEETHHQSSQKKIDRCEEKTAAALFVSEFVTFLLLLCMYPRYNSS